MSIAFIMAIHEEKVSLIMDCVQRIRLHHPKAIIVVMDDKAFTTNARSTMMAEALSAQQAFFVPSSGARLKELCHGARWWKRFLSWAHMLDCYQCVKIDPDTRVHAPISNRTLGQDSPLHGVSGSLMSKGHPEQHVQGGCQVFDWLVINILRQHLEDNGDRYADPDSWRIGQADYFISKGEVSCDYMLRQMMLDAGVPMIENPSFDCHSIVPASFREGAEVTHPHK